MKEQRPQGWVAAAGHWGQLNQRGALHLQPPCTRMSQSSRGQEETSSARATSLKGKTSGALPCHSSWAHDGWRRVRELGESGASQTLHAGCRIEVREEEII